MITFHVGLHKTGTTYLQKEVFPQYDGCFVGVRGKGRYADALRHLAHAPVGQYRPELVRELLADLEAAHGTVLLSRESLSGTLWNGALESGRRTARRLSAFSGDVQVILCIRRQESMLRSTYAQYVRQGGIEPPESFVDASAGGFTFETKYLEYDQIIESYVTALGVERVLVLPYERLEKDPASFARTIADFVGATFTGICPTRRRNVSLHGSRLDALRRWNRLFRRSRFNDSPRLPLPGAAFWRYPLQISQVGREPPPPGTAWLDLLPTPQREAYRQGNRRIQEISRLDLESWGYMV